MTAPIYARKPTEERNVDEEQKSVTRQIEHARQYAARKGWTVDEGSIFVNDGIFGAEFANRPGFVRLMNASKPRPRFQVLIMSEDARLGREAIETAYALNQLMRAGVHVWFYLDERERTLDSPMEKAMLALQSMSDEMEREKARARTYDAMRRKFEQGQVTGGQCFGYRNVDVLAAGAESGAAALPETGVTLHSGDMGDTLSCRGRVSGRGWSVASWTSTSGLCPTAGRTEDGALYEVALCERSAGTSLQISLEGDRALHIRKLDGRDQHPGPVGRRMDRPSRIVRTEASPHVGRQTDVVAGGGGNASKNINESVVGQHGSCSCK
jgi:DNA invertase Pin-like site-specific DNA recombinase